jgi:ribosomal protein L7Ae-like RNA K-turn-binding protein
MSIKEISEAIKNEKALFGIKQCVKHKKKVESVFICKDTRDETVDKLEDEKIEFSVLKTKKEMAKELNLDFLSEVFSLVK